MDLKNKQGSPRHARIKSIIKDSAETSRYVQCEYRISQKKFATVKRTAQSLILVYKKMSKKQMKKNTLTLLITSLKKILDMNRKGTRSLLKLPRIQI